MIMPMGIRLIWRGAAATEHVHEQDPQEASPRIPLRFQDHRPMIDEPLDNDIKENSVEDFRTSQNLGAAGESNDRNALQDTDDKDDMDPRSERVPRQCSEDLRTSTLLPVPRAPAKHAITHHRNIEWRGVGYSRPTPSPTRSSTAENAGRDSPASGTPSERLPPARTSPQAMVAAASATAASAASESSAASSASAP